MAGIFLEPWARFLVLLHAAASVVLVGACTHHFLIALGYLRGTYKVKLGRIYAAIIAIAYPVTMLFGALAYPTYRYHVRALYFDRHAAWASNLFDIKENFASIGLPLAIGAFVLSRVIEPRQDRSLVFGYFVAVTLVAAIVWFNVVSGLLLTMERGV
jgi:hypothetical protein